MTDRPTIDVGPAIQQSRLPGWLKRILAWLRGTKIHAGPVDIQLDQKSGASTGPSGMPHQPGPPVVPR